MYSEILIRYGELSLKGKNKMSFIRKLETNIQKLAGINPSTKFDRMTVPYSEDNLKNLQNIFGIYSYSPVILLKNNDLSEIENLIKKLVDSEKPKSFKVETKRRYKGFSKTSSELNGHIGAIILTEFPSIKVDVHNPEMKIEIDIRENETRIFIKRILGLGGLPTGINGKVLHLMSGGIDSPVAAFEMMKRGIHVDFLNFITPPHTDEKTIDKVDRLVKTLIKYQGYATIFRSNYTDLMNLIGLTSNQAYKINLMRRSFYRIADALAIKNGYLGLANGENLGQVASQTLESIETIASQASLPIYRPILTADKLETIAKGKKINTYDISIEQANESCEIFAPKAPVTCPTNTKAQALEDELVDLKKLEKDNIENLEIFKVKL